jgi:hypothetical protein
MSAEDPITDGLKNLGIKVEPREASPIEQILASGVGGIAGTAIGSMAGASWLGRAVLSLGGSLLGHILVTHRFVPDRPATDRPLTEGEDGEEGPSRWSDRR